MMVMGFYLLEQTGQAILLILGVSLYVANCFRTSG